MTARQIVLDFLRIGLSEKDPERAARTYLSSGYKQHNPDIGDGPDAFVTAIGGLLSGFPDFSFETKRVIGQGDMVALHSFLRFTKDERGHAVVDIFRVVDGKIAEHWDVIQPVPEASANDNTMF